MRSKTSLAFLALISILSIPRLALSEDAKVETLDKIICAIDNNMITLEQMEIERAILAYSKDSLLHQGRESELTLAQTLEELVARRLLLNAAVKMGFGRTDATIADKELDDFRKSYGSKENYQAFLKRYQLTDPAVLQASSHVPSALDIDYRFKSLAVVKKFVNKKLELQVKLGLENYLTEHKGRLSKDHPEAGEEDLKKLAEKDLYRQKLLEWIRDIASRARISVLDDEYRDDLDVFLKMKGDSKANLPAE